MKKTILVLYSLGLFISNVFSQSDTTKQTISKVHEDKAHFILSAGISYQKQAVGEIGVIYGYSSLSDVCNPGGVVGIKLASEFNFNRNKFFIAPKLGAELNYFIFGLRLNVIDYTDFMYHDFKFTPEIGLSLMGAINLFYGYNCSLTPKRLENIGTHRITLTVNFDRIFLGK
jgi:hypothetical protein